MVVEDAACFVWEDCEAWLRQLAAADSGIAG